MMRCRACGEVNDDGAVFCGNCGSRVGGLSPDEAPAAFSDDAPRRSSALPLLALAVAIALVVVVGAAVYVLRQGSSSAPTPRQPTTVRVPTTTVVTGTAPPHLGGPSTARQQVEAVNAIVQNAIRDRSSMETAIVASRSCRDLVRSARTIEMVMADRRAILQVAGHLDVSKLPNGSQLRDRLVRALNASLQADVIWVPWSDPRDCIPGRAYPPAAKALNRQAHAVKSAFLALWNPLAARTGFSVVPPPTSPGSM
jgi:hypothetical protein